MTYKYDGLNRLTNAEMKNYHDGFDLYFENFSYDKNSNILSLSRGWKDSMEDDLSFAYSGNQMTRVADAGNDMYLSSVPQIPCNIYDNAFSYDENGNRTKDIPRKISSIAYNSLNLPSQITKNNGDYMKIKYGADGKKHSSESHWAVAENVQPGDGNIIISPISRKYTHYAANAIYEGETSSLTTLMKIYIDGGFLIYDTETSRYKYHYYYNDHLGSNCMIVDESGKILQEADYLPSGLPTSEYGPLTTDNKLHLDMEFESLLGIHFYDNEARWRDPIYNRFTSIDPLCEKYSWISPYAVCANNSLRYVDYNGMDIWEIDNGGKIINYIEDKTQDAFYMVTKNEVGNYERTFTIDGNGNKIYNNISFEYGAVESQKTDSFSPDGKTADIYKIRGDENGTKLFEFMSKNTSVEWSQAKTGIEGNKGLNFLTTSHMKDSESGMSLLFETQLYAGYSIRELNHNHPNDTPRPSGLGTGTGDISFSKMVTESLMLNNLKIPIFQIYIPSKNGYIRYRSKSIRNEFK